MFELAKREWEQGRRVPLFDPSDAIAWYVHQAVRYADPSLRPDFHIPEGHRIAPVFRRLGQVLTELREVEGIEERAVRLMTDGRSQPDDGIYELLVAAAYRRRGWDRVAFVPETPGLGKSPDLFVGRTRTSWAVECKRAGRSAYARDERTAGEHIARSAHQRSLEARRPVIVMVRFASELVSTPTDYLAEKVARFLERGKPYEWIDDFGTGGVADVNWTLMHSVLADDDVYFGSSRMVELLLGRYDYRVDYSVEGNWTPAEGRPFHATHVDHASIVAWTSGSVEASRRKAQHFRGVVGRASKQLPGDRPGVVHVGYEAIGGNSVDGLRHYLNTRQMRTFDASRSRLRWVYGNFIMPEQVTARYESSAVSETTAAYKVGRSGTCEPLRGHMLFKDEDGRPGAHFG